jgi:hypothetical protein
LAGRAGAAFRRSPTVWRGAVFGAAFGVVPGVAFGAAAAGRAAVRGVAPLPAGAGVSRSPMLGIAARAGGLEEEVEAPRSAALAAAGGFGGCAAGLSVARADGDRVAGAGRSLSSGGGFDPVTTVCPLLQAASSTLEGGPPNAEQCSQILPGLPSAGAVANQLSESQASEEQIWRNGARLPQARASDRGGGTPARHWCRQTRTNSTARH